MDGILAGCDSAQEWLLPWWHRNLRRHNPEIPVAFGDLGMSEQARLWCERHGTLIPASQIPAVSPLKSNKPPWLYQGKSWTSERLKKTKFVWFQKPFLMQQSPFERTIWLDLDCEVRGPLSPLFSLQLPPTKLAIMTLSTYFKMTSEKNDLLYVKDINGGVVLFEKGSHLLDFWVYFTNLAYDKFCGDDFILAFAISKYRFPAGKIPYKYNWYAYWGDNPEAVIVHWITEKAKENLKRIIAFESNFS